MCTIHIGLLQGDRCRGHWAAWSPGDAGTGARPLARCGRHCGLGPRGCGSLAFAVLVSAERGACLHHRYGRSAVRASLREGGALLVTFVTLPVRPLPILVHLHLRVPSPYFCSSWLPSGARRTRLRGEGSRRPRPLAGGPWDSV